MVATRASSKATIVLRPSAATNKAGGAANTRPASKRRAPSNALERKHASAIIRIPASATAAAPVASAKAKTGGERDSAPLSGRGSRGRAGRHMTPAERATLLAHFWRNPFLTAGQDLAKALAAELGDDRTPEKVANWFTNERNRLKISRALWDTGARWGPSDDGETAVRIDKTVQPAPLPSASRAPPHPALPSATPQINVTPASSADAAAEDLDVASVNGVRVGRVEHHFLSGPGLAAYPNPHAHRRPNPHLEPPRVPAKARAKMLWRAGPAATSRWAGLDKKDVEAARWLTEWARTHSPAPLRTF